MSSINRPLSGPMMTFDLQEQLASIRADDAYAKHGRSARTLAKSGRFRLVLAALTDGHEIATHQAESPLTIQVLEGDLQYRTDTGVNRLRTGEILFFGPGDAHDIRANGDSAVLITISAIGDDFDQQG
jgi:quercetin dioxygenase-like cupin family protein